MFIMKEQIPGPSYHTKEPFSIRMQVLPIIHLNQRPNATDKGIFFFFKDKYSNYEGKMPPSLSRGIFLMFGLFMLK